MVVKDSLITAQNGTRGRFENTNRYFLDLIVGENEQAHSSVSVRMRDAEEGRQDLGEMSLPELSELVRK